MRFGRRSRMIRAIAMYAKPTSRMKGAIGEEMACRVAGPPTCVARSVTPRGDADICACGAAFTETRTLSPGSAG